MQQERLSLPVTDPTTEISKYEQYAPKSGEANKLFEDLQEIYNGITQNPTRQYCDLYHDQLCEVSKMPESRRRSSPYYEKGEETFGVPKLCKNPAICAHKGFAHTLLLRTITHLLKHGELTAAESAKISADINALQKHIEAVDQEM